MALLRLDIVLKSDTITFNVFICGLLPRDEYIPVDRVYIIETNKISKVKCLLKKFIFNDQDKYWT